MRSHKNWTKFLAGFTLVELLVVTGIILILTVLILPNYRVNQRQNALFRASHKLAQDIRKAQEMAMSAKNCTECGGVVPPGYGIYLEKDDDYYLFYADTSPVAGNEKYTGGDTVIETIFLEEGVYIKDITPVVAASINFKPPDPKIKLSGTGLPDGDELLITLALETDSTKTKTIKVNKAGLIEIQ